MDQDPTDEAMDELLAVGAEQWLIVSSWPGQSESNPYPAPPHIKKQLSAGMKMPFIRHSTQKELQDYGVAHKLFSAKLHEYLTKDWGSW